MRRKLVIAVVGSLYALGLLGFFSLCGFYSIPPSLVAPDGVTRIVMRAPGDPFFNSPVLACLADGLSADCFVQEKPVPRRQALMELPFMPWAHSAAVGGARS